MLKIKVLKAKFVEIIIMLIFLQPVFAQTSKQHQFFEKDYQKIWCNSHCGTMEMVLPDKARVDCVTKTHAIEFDFASKWAESIGQALYYAEILHKTPGIVLIIEDKTKDKKYIKRVQTIANKHCITLWLIFPENIEKYLKNQKSSIKKPS